MNSMSSAIILLRMGLSLRLENQIGDILKLCYIPYFMEVIISTIFIYLLRDDATILNSITTAFIMCPIGAAVLI